MTGMPLRVYLTGRTTIEYDGEVIDQDAFPGKQGLLAFVRLAMDRAHAVSRSSRSPRQSPRPTSSRPPRDRPEAFRRSAGVRHPIARSLIALVGAGGKTTTMFSLASELAEQGLRVVTTSTTNLYIPRQSETDTVIVSPETPALIEMVSLAWQQHQHVTVAARFIEGRKIR